ncbi:hypothetical protein [Nibricoccus aquaticus]|nr:hypothetical protein [Nibricoccus aquaticus]
MITLTEFKRRHPRLADFADSISRTVAAQHIEKRGGVESFPEDLLKTACEVVGQEKRNAANGRYRTASASRFCSGR